MKRTTCLIVAWIAAGAAMMSIAVAPAAADELDDLKKRFKQRYAQLLELKQQGKIGETWQGLIDAVKPQYKEDQKIKALIDAENDDRKALYRLIAKQEETQPDIVAERNARRNFEKARKGEYLKTPDDKWRQKS